MGYPKEIYEKVWEILEQRQRNSKQRLQQNQDEIRKEIPEIADIQAKMVVTASQITKAVVTSPDRAKELINRLAAESGRLQQRRKELLLDGGYPDDYLTEKHVCEICEDKGYLGTEPCECFKELLKRQAFTELTELADNERCTFENFSLDYYSELPDNQGVVPRRRMQDVLEYSRSYANAFSKDSPSLLMIGKTGLGKTHISLAIAWEVTQAGFGVVYTPVQRLMDRLEAQKFSYSSESKEAYSQTINSVLECDLLVLDDLGTEFITSFTTSVLYNIVNSRMVEGRPTIINTNLEPVELEKHYSQRMASRLGFGYKILSFFGDDIRFVKRQNQFRKK